LAAFDQADADHSAFALGCEAAVPGDLGVVLLAIPLRVVLVLAVLDRALSQLTCHIPPNETGFRACDQEPRAKAIARPPPLSFARATSGSPTAKSPETTRSKPLLRRASFAV